MNDSYLNFVNSPLGARLARSLGLPKPEVLRRHRADEPEFGGVVAIGAGREPQLLDALANLVASIGVTSVAHESAGLWVPLATRHGLMTGRFEPADSGSPGRLAALLFDASGIDDSSQLEPLHGFFHDTLRSLGKCGRIVVLGRPPESCASPRQWTAQRALEGFTRSLGKEARRGITANLVYVEQGAESGVETSLRFFLSPRSAYVSGQVVRIGSAAGAGPQAAAPAFDWKAPLAGRRAVVTGAARGIGASIASVLAAEGAHVIGIDIPAARDALDLTMRQLNGTALAFDIAAPEAPAQIAAALDEQGVDIVVHNAGITRDKTIAKMTASVWQSVIDINLCAQERIDDALLAAGIVRDGGRIIGVSSISGIAGNLGQTNYATSKAGVIGRVQGMAPHLRARGITINAVAPGFIETQMTARMPFTLREAGRRMNAMSQGGQPVDVAQTIAWLAHPGSAGITGQVVRVCGQSLIGA
ncbi:3-oxoacyl-ACP reductase [Paraburkholderia sp. 22099]|jgi:3-oxoacyl-[acyl-carrier protein] reductase|uniref:3-oxoacyl-[acyl-carrier protein] reductase n=1 Tax=Paraburkholderia terricola TaxID=169427 RepID=A0ABU1LUI1_9BURK|nr:3-oxoacyl-ACP reductase [Paraburkholderia terricola]MDR6410429.1 3-oxoacyl-[acyl-carrier protein] reductase [Paraburkholderia terricola]MDR6484691.1 3-oxoacyl-[acyl-carrier protein] reductase [Paraburkholderia terricola]MDR6495330.1 3-oxoacyl-[acyl-carrier protein] reductase [Paraburkholderia terricola]